MVQPPGSSAKKVGIAAQTLSPVKKVLLVEDDLQIARAIALRLESRGYEVLTAADGCDGLFEALEHRPDVIVMDIMMPKGLGFSVAQRLQALGFGHIPIIFITANKLECLAQMARNIGAFDYLEKPFETKQRLIAISRALTQKTKKSRASELQLT